MFCLLMLYSGVKIYRLLHRVIHILSLLCQLFFFSLPSLKQIVSSKDVTCRIICRKRAMNLIAITAVWWRNMSRSRESRLRGSRKLQAKVTAAARARTLNRFQIIIMGYRDLLS